VSVSASSIREGRLPTVRDVREFDKRTGSLLERLIFNHRGWVLLLCAVFTALLGWRATKLEVNADFEKMIPQGHPYIRNLVEHRDSLKSFGNSIRIVISNQRGDIFDADYLELLKKINDKVYLMPGVDRSMMRSVWMPIVRWAEVTEEGSVGGPVMPQNYDGSPEAMQRFRLNLARAGVVGELVAQDFKSSMIAVPLVERISETGQPIDYRALSHVLEREVRDVVREHRAPDGSQPYAAHIVGFAKIVGDLIDGLGQVLGFFAASACIAGVLIYWYTRDLRSTMLLCFCALLGVLWLLGLLQLLGYDLNPYSILVPFLVFSIGLSHGAQKMSGVMQDIGRGTHRYVAARYTFRRLFTAGLTALLANVVGFAVLMIIDIPVIRELALAASLGVLVLIFTKLCLIPVALSYIGVSASAAERSIREEQDPGQSGARLWSMLGNCSERRYAVPLVVGALLIGGVATTVSLTRLKIGDLDAGAPELRADSRYNLDAAFINQHYGLSSDQFVVIATTPQEGMSSYQALADQDRLVWTLRQLPSVSGTSSLPEMVRRMTAAGFEGDPRWQTIPRSPSAIASALRAVTSLNPDLIGRNWSVTPIVAYLRDHKADTLSEVVAAVESFGAQHNGEHGRFLLGAGSAGIEATTNIVVKQANYRMLALLYLAVTVLCYLTFRSWRAVVVAMVPLLITAMLCEALMVALGIGVKVATLPVVALGVGVGVDYALYLLSIQISMQRSGMPLRQAYMTALRFTGRIVALIGVTMAASVAMWAFSPIKFQADMGLLLTFMFLWNMVGALVLIPALSYFLLRPKQISTAQPASAVVAHAT
jgi:predicted RND superfamily exporter protein